MTTSEIITSLTRAGNAELPQPLREGKLRLFFEELTPQFTWFGDIYYKYDKQSLTLNDVVSITAKTLLKDNQMDTGVIPSEFVGQIRTTVQKGNEKYSTRGCLVSFLFRMRTIFTSIVGQSQLDSNLSILLGRSCAQR